MLAGQSEDEKRVVFKIPIILMMYRFRKDGTFAKDDVWSLQ